MRCLSYYTPEFLLLLHTNDSRDDQYSGLTLYHARARVTLAGPRDAA
jgi:hypothetical protein